MASKGLNVLVESTVPGQAEFIQELHVVYNFRGEGVLKCTVLVKMLITVNDPLSLAPFSEFDKIL